ncbi:MAG: SufE family protein [Rhodothermales bacterium]
MSVAAELASLAGLLAELDATDRLEILTDYASRLPALDPAWAPARDAGLHMVLECQSPVFFVARLADGRVEIHADVPAEAPVARGFVSLLITLFDGAPAESLREAPANILDRLGLSEALGMRRRHGLGAIYRRLLEAGA